MWVDMKGFGLMPARMKFSCWTVECFVKSKQQQQQHNSHFRTLHLSVLGSFPDILNISIMKIQWVKILHVHLIAIRIFFCYSCRVCCVCAMKIRAGMKIISNWKILWYSLLEILYKRWLNVIISMCFGLN